MNCNCIKDLEERLAAKISTPGDSARPWDRGEELINIGADHHAILLKDGRTALGIGFHTDWQRTAKTGRVMRARKTLTINANFCPFCGKATNLQAIDSESARDEGISIVKFWPDECRHGPGEYVCSFTTTDTAYGEGQEIHYKIDLYLFNGPLGQHTCLRFGPNGEDYFSPGVSSNLLKFASQPYLRAGEILTRFGRFQWNRKDEA